MRTISVNAVWESEKNPWGFHPCLKVCLAEVITKLEEMDKLNYPKEEIRIIIKLPKADMLYGKRVVYET